MAGLFTNPINTIKSLWGGGNNPPATPSFSAPTAQAEEKSPPITTQLYFPADELQALCLRIDQDWQGTVQDQQVRRDRCAEQEANWRKTFGLAGGEQGKSNFLVQIITAIVLAKHARETEAMFGARAAVNATPTGPTDAKLAKRISLAMKWQVFENMQALKPLSLACLRRLKHGRAFIKIPWTKKSYNKTTIDPQTRKRHTKRVVYREGPELISIHNDDIILPSSVEGKVNFDDLQTAEFVGIRYWDTLTNMLLGDNQPGAAQNPEGDMYQGIAANWEKLVSLARAGNDRDSEKDPSRIVSDYDEGVDRSSATGVRREQIEILEWHMKWRRWYHEGDAETGRHGDTEEESENYVDSNSSGDGNVSDGLPSGVAQDSPKHLVEGQEYHEAGGEAADLAEAGNDFGSTYPDGTFIDTDGKRKYMIESNLIVRKCAKAQIIVGIQDADEVYPDMAMKRPIVSLALMNDGQFWGMGVIEMIEQIAKEMTKLTNQVIQASDMTIGPPIFYDPSAGEAFVNRKYEPFDLIPVANAAGIQQLDIKADLSSFPMLWQLFMSLIEMLTGITQGVMGRGMEQPNAPRTLGGQRLISGASDVRLALDMRMLAEDLKPVLDLVWGLWTSDDSGKEQFYRVAEGDARNFFDHADLTNGWAAMGAKEKEGHYDFSFEFSDDLAIKEQKKQEGLALMGIISRAPIFMNDPVMQYRIMVDVFDWFGLDFTKYASEPPPPFLPLLPETEWSLVLEGEEIHIHPQDDDQAHIDDHESRIYTMMQAPEEDQDMDAMFKMKMHIEEHQQAMQQKQAQQALVAGITQAMAQAGVTPQGKTDPLSAMLGGMGGQAGQPGQMPQAQPQPMGGMPQL